MLLHRHEIAIRVQQGMAVLDAERSYDQVRSLPDRNAETTQASEESSSLHGNTGIHDLFQLKLLKRPLDLFRLAIVSGSLQQLKKNDIGDDYIKRVLGIELSCLWSVIASYPLYPD